jgi:hypothetical protein
MNIKKKIQYILKEYVDQKSHSFKTETVLNPIIYWHLTEHSKERMRHERNIEQATKQEIKEMCQIATPKLIKILADKRNNFKGGPFFKFNIVDKNNFYLTLACEVDSHKTLEELHINIKTVLKSGGFLKLKGFGGLNEPTLLTIEV